MEGVGRTGARAIVVVTVRADRSRAAVDGHRIAKIIAGARVAGGDDLLLCPRAPAAGVDIARAGARAGMVVPMRAHQGRVTVERYRYAKVIIGSPIAGGQLGLLLPVTTLITFKDIS